MNLKEMVQSYEKKGMLKEAAQSHAASEVLLSKIASSELAEHVTIKGGIVMYTLTQNARRATTDVDFDFIHYSIEDPDIVLFIEKLNEIADGIKLKALLPFEELVHQDYKGKRVIVEFRDQHHNKLKLKLDIGVHTYTGIDQTKLMFSTQVNQGGVSLWVNPPEQIVTEKIFSLAKIGPASTRYKDVFDVYYLIEKNLLDKRKVSYYFSLFLRSGHYAFTTFSELYQRVDNTLNDPVFSKDASTPKNDWLNVDYQTVKDVLLDYLYSL